MPAGRVNVHPIEAGENAEPFSLPTPGTPSDVTCMALSAHFLVCGTQRGMVMYFQPETRALLNEFKHEEPGIRRVFPQPVGTRCAACRVTQSATQESLRLPGGLGGVIGTRSGIMMLLPA